MKTTKTKPALGSLELSPTFDSAQSFYGKARVVQDQHNAYTWHLYSYETLVAMADTEDYEVELYEDWDSSATTLRHVKEFLKQHGFKADTKAQMTRDYPQFSKEELCTSSH